MKGKVIFLTPRDLVKRWNVSEKTITRWRKKGRWKQKPLKYYKMGSLVRFKLADIKAYEIKHCLVRTAHISASDDSTAAKTNLFNKFIDMLAGLMSFSLGELKQRREGRVFDINCMDVAMGMKGQEEEDDDAMGEAIKASVTSFKAKKLHTKSQPRNAQPVKAQPANGRNSSQLTDLNKLDKLTRSPEALSKLPYWQKRVSRDRLLRMARCLDGAMAAMEHESTR